MLTNFNNREDMESIKAGITFYTGSFELLAEAADVPAMPFFSEPVMSFLEAFSKKLLHAEGVAAYPDVATLGFWCRRASLEKMKQEHKGTDFRIGRGIAFHIAPSNVAVNFAYSMIAAMLAGNINVVRLPSKHFEQIDRIIAALQSVLDEFPKMKPYLFLVRYNRDKRINDYLSALCDIRIIWGGDHTISSMRQSPIGPRAKEICFADRYSICVIHADHYLDEGKYGEVARGFYNDTYLNDQNACTSPKLIVWMGKKIQQAKKIFWEELHRVVSEKYELGAVQMIDKLEAALLYAGTAEEDTHPVLSVYDEGNRIYRVKIDQIKRDLLDVKQNSGIFFEYDADELCEILPVCTNKLQSIAAVGIPGEMVEEFIGRYCPRGIDRVVSVGGTLDFSLIWDGFDLPVEMSRRIYLEI